MSTSSQVVRKPLDDDCLLNGGLHPDIADRLERVRELPVRSVANFRGVEVDTEGVWLVWEHVQGTTLEAFLSVSRQQDRLDEIARDLTRAVHGLHAYGLVHGALHARNVIIDPRGQVVLTHLSPLLHDDIDEDERALRRLLAGLGQPMAGNGESLDSADPDDRPVRVRAYLLAGAAVIGGLVMFLAILWYIRA